MDSKYLLTLYKQNISFKTTPNDLCGAIHSQILPWTENFEIQLLLNDCRFRGTVRTCYRVYLQCVRLYVRTKCKKKKAYGVHFCNICIFSQVVSIKSPAIKKTKNKKKAC